MAIDLNTLNAEADQMLASSIKVLNTPVATPGYTGTNLGPTKQALSRASASRDETSKAIDESRGISANALQENKRGLDAKAQAEGAKARADQQRAQLEADQYRVFSEMFGITIDPASIVGQAAARLATERPIAEEKLRKVQEMQSVGFLDDPLEYIYNAFQLPPAINDYNRQADIVNSLQNSVDRNIQTAQNAANLTAKGVPTIIASQAESVADLALAGAQIAKANADEAFARTNVDFATKKLAGDLSIASATLQTTQLQMQENHNKFQASVAAIQAADSRANRMIKAGELLTRLADNQSLDVLLQNYDRMIGKPPGTTTRQVFKSFSDEQQKNIAAIAAGSGGANAYDAFVNIAKVIPGNAMSPETRVTMEWMQGAINKHNSLMEQAQIPKEQRPVRLAQEIKKEIDREKAQAYKIGTLFHEVEPKKLVEAGLIAKDSKLAIALDPLMKTDAPMTPEAITSTIMKLYPNPVEAGHVIAQYYDANLTFMNTAGNFKLLKIDPLKSYKVPGEKGLLGLGFGDSMPMYDLTKPEEATKYVLRTQVREAALKIMRPTGQFTLRGAQGSAAPSTMRDYTRITE